MQGNQAPRISIEASCIDTPVQTLHSRTSRIGTAATASEIATASSFYISHTWTTLLNTTPLAPGLPSSRLHVFPVLNPERFTHIRVNLFPDGGVARLRVHGLVTPSWRDVSPSTLVNLAGVEYGGRSLSHSNAHYGIPGGVIKRRTK
jgi:allantoicase